MIEILLFYICYVEMNIAFVVVPKEAFLGKACDRTRTPCTRLRLPRCAEYNALKWQVVVSTMSAKSPWNTHTVLGIFHPRPIFAAEMTIVSPLPPSYNVESIAEVLSYLERYHFSLQCYAYHLQTTLLSGEGIL